MHCCAGVNVALLALGAMDLRVMAIATAAISAERLMPGGTRVAQGIGLAMIAAGAVRIALAVLGD